MTEEFPIYYRYKGPKISDQFTADKIYEIQNPLNFEAEGNFIDDRGKQNGFSPFNSQYFDLATKLEWMTQQGMMSVKSSIHKLSDLLTDLKIQ
jgi:hypothetical protein